MGWGAKKGLAEGLQRVSEIWMTAAMEDQKQQRLMEYQRGILEENREYAKAEKADDRTYEAKLLADQRALAKAEKGVTAEYVTEGEGDSKRTFKVTTHGDGSQTREEVLPESGWGSLGAGRGVYQKGTGKLALIGDGTGAAGGDLSKTDKARLDAAMKLHDSLIGLEARTPEQESALQNVTGVINEFVGKSKSVAAAEVEEDKRLAARKFGTDLEAFKKSQGGGLLDPEKQKKPEAAPTYSQRVNTATSERERKAITDALNVPVEAAKSAAGAIGKAHTNALIENANAAVKRLSGKKVQTPTDAQLLAAIADSPEYPSELRTAAAKILQASGY